MIKRLLKLLAPGGASRREAPPDQIDVRRLMEQHTAEEFNRAAEDYFRQHSGNAAFYLKKPLGHVAEASQQLIFFAEVLAGLKPLPGMRLLDFGAGTCWTSRYFADFKLKVIACDISETALAIGKQRFTQNPPIDSPFKPDFSVFNGRRIDLPDESVDRIACFDAFHHVPNPQEVLREFARVLKPGGIAGFSEPGPQHSKTAQSQLEMKNHMLIENDTLLEEEVWPWAQAAGFTDIQVAVFNSTPFSVGLKEFSELVKRGSGSAALKAYARHVRRRADDRRTFFLLKGSPALADSRERTGLMCEMGVEVKASRTPARGWIEGLAVVRNSGAGLWLSSDALFGPVKLGLHLKSADGQLLNYDFGRAKMPPGRKVGPGETVEIPFRLAAPAEAGDYIVEFDMVSEEVCWFSSNGALIVAVPITVDK